MPKSRDLVSTDRLSLNLPIPNLHHVVECNRMRACLRVLQIQLQHKETVLAMLMDMRAKVANGASVRGLYFNSALLLVLTFLRRIGSTRPASACSIRSSVAVSEARILLAVSC